MSTPNFTVDFFSDWIDLLKQDLASFGYSTTSLSDEKIQIAYFNLKWRLIEPKKRTILKSQEFSCPPDRLAGLNRLENEITSGSDLKPYLSKYILDLNYNDDLLNHWGIYHLHLGNCLDGSGFIKREGPLLFVKFDKENAYLIDVRDHKSWSEQTLIQVIHDNWPQTISSFRYPVETRLAYQAKDVEVAKLRKAQINSPVGVKDGSIYGSMGGGATSSGVSGEVVSLMLNAKKKIYRWQEQVQNNTANIVKDAESKGVNFLTEHTIRLHFENSVAYAVEQNNMFHMRLGSL